MQPISKRKVSEEEKTRRMAIIAAFIQKFIDDNKYSPTIREIAKGTGYKSMASLYEYLGVMRSRGEIDWQKGHRTIKPTKG